MSKQRRLQVRTGKIVGKKGIHVRLDKALKVESKDLNSSRREWFAEVYFEAINTLKFKTLGELVGWMIDNIDTLEV